jgi:hypothetical protein
MSWHWRGRTTSPVNPVLEAMTDNDKRAARPLGRYALIRWRLSGFGRTVVLGHGFERAQKISAGRRDFPALIIAKQITAAEDINGWRPSGKAL